MRINEEKTKARAARIHNFAKHLFLLFVLVWPLNGNAQNVQMPDRALTPGEVRTTSVNEVCHGGSTRLVRHTTKAMKKQVCNSYRMKSCPKQGYMEIDHLIPLELGGADTVANLWPQLAKPTPGFHEKDKLENYLHAQVCSGKMALIDAQAKIRTDWFAAYQDMLHAVWHNFKLPEDWTGVVVLQ